MHSSPLLSNTAAPRETPTTWLAEHSGKDVSGSEEARPTRRASSAKQAWGARRGKSENVKGGRQLPDLLTKTALMWMSPALHRMVLGSRNC